MKAWLPLLVSVVGLLVFALASDGKVITVGHTMFGAGLLAFLLLGVPKLPKLGE